MQVATSPCYRWDFPDVIPVNPSLGAWAPVTAVPRSASACFFLHVIGLPPYAIEVGYSRVFPSKRFLDGSLFRDCSHFFMFKPPSLLASPIVPTAATYVAGQPRLLHPSRTCFVSSTCIGHANHPTQAIGGVGTYTPLDSQPCRLLQH